MFVESVVMPNQEILCNTTVYVVCDMLPLGGNCNFFNAIHVSVPLSASFYLKALLLPSLRLLCFIIFCSFFYFCFILYHSCQENGNLDILVFLLARNTAVREPFYILHHLHTLRIYDTFVCVGKLLFHYEISSLIFCNKTYVLRCI